YLLTCSSAIKELRNSTRRKYEDFEHSVEPDWPWCNRIDGYHLGREDGSKNRRRLHHPKCPCEPTGAGTRRSGHHHSRRHHPRTDAPARPLSLSGRWVSGTGSYAADAIRF